MVIVNSYANVYQIYKWMVDYKGISIYKWSKMVHFYKLMVYRWIFPNHPAMGFFFLVDLTWFDKCWRMCIFLQFWNMWNTYAHLSLYLFLRWDKFQVSSIYGCMLFENLRTIVGSASASPIVSQLTYASIWGYNMLHFQTHPCSLRYKVGVGGLNIVHPTFSNISIKIWYKSTGSIWGYEKAGCNIVNREHWETGRYKATTIAWKGGESIQQQWE